MPTSPVMDEMQSAYLALIGAGKNVCGHLDDGDSGYACLCCRTVVRCASCHEAHLAAVPCPVCGAAQDPEIRHAIEHEFELRGNRVRRTNGDRLYRTLDRLVISATVCASCAIENDLPNLTG